MNEPREDGPAVAQLFANIDARVGYREEVPAGMDIRKAMTREEMAQHAPVCEELLQMEELAKDEVEHLGSCATFNEGGGDCTCGAIGLMPAEDSEEGEVAGHAFIQSVGKALHAGGEAAINILAEMCAAEFALGNPRNMPEPMLGWYALTLGYQLCVFEFTARDEGERFAHAEQLKRCIGALADRTDYARGVQDEVKALLTERKPIVAKLLGADFDPTYGDALS